MEPSQLSPNYRISVGTQVVLKRDHDVIGRPKGPDGQVLFKKAGSVGIVAEAPVTNEYAYVIRFGDGLTVRAKQKDLVVRRSDAPEDDLPAREIAAYEPYVIYAVRVGSHAFGLADADSDEDERGVYLPPADWHWSLQPLPEQIEFKRAPDGRLLDHNQTDGEADICWWELGKFLRLALKANPNVLEVLYVPDAHVLRCDALGRKLRELRAAFLSKYLYQTYSGYVLSQFRKMKKDLEHGKEHRPKHACHLIRLLYSGIAALKGDGVLVDVGRHREELLRYKHGEVPFADVHARALELDREFQAAFAASRLPDRPDVAAVERFLVGARRSRA